jgi:hypothetical protein
MADGCILKTYPSKSQRAQPGFICVLRVLVGKIMSDKLLKYSFKKITYQAKQL